MHRLKYVVFFVCFVWAGSISAKNLKYGGKMDILNSKPMFEVRWKATNIRYFLMVNGFAIHREYCSTGEVKTRHPINHLFRSGTNTVQLAVIPNEKNGGFSEGQQVSVELWVYSDGNENEEYKIGDLVFQGTADESNMVLGSLVSGKKNSRRGFVFDSEGDVEVCEVSVLKSSIYPGSLAIERDFIVPNSLPLWGFFKGEKISTIKNLSESEQADLKDDLYREYQAIEDALVGGEENIIKVMPAFSERNRDIDLAFYKEAGSTEKELLDAMVRDASDSTKELVRLAPEKVKIQLEENSRIIALTRNRGASAIVFNFTEFSGCTRYDIFFRRENGKWIICR